MTTSTSEQCAPADTSATARALLLVSAAVTALMLVLAACSGGDDANESDLSGADKTLAGSLAQYLGVDRDSAFSEGEIWCIADGMVTGLGGADAVNAKYRLNADNIGVGVRIDSLDPEDAEAVADAYRSCADIGQLTADIFIAQGFTEDEAACLSSNVGDVYIDSLAADLTGDPALRADAANAIRSGRVEAGEACGLEVSPS